MNLDTIAIMIILGKLQDLISHCLVPFIKMKLSCENVTNCYDNTQDLHHNVSVLDLELSLAQPNSDVQNNSNETDNILTVLQSFHKNATAYVK